MSADTLDDPAESRSGNPDCTGVTATCQRDGGECMTCGARDCPHGGAAASPSRRMPRGDGEFGDDYDDPNEWDDFFKPPPPTAQPPPGPPDPRATAARHFLDNLRRRDAERDQARRARMRGES